MGTSALVTWCAIGFVAVLLQYGVMVDIGYSIMPRQE